MGALSPCLRRRSSCSRTRRRCTRGTGRQHSITFINDYSLHLLDRDERLQFYANHNMGWVARQQNPVFQCEGDYYRLPKRQNRIRLDSLFFKTCLWSWSRV
ncbi:hypothetical protein B0H11DRAFT_1707385 [Mycena galericulata]|nr:hypothetical protein B0H11DRAFT_1707385 [Mycena galericulata]